HYETPTEASYGGGLRRLATETGYGDRLRRPAPNWLRTQTDYAWRSLACCRTTGCSRRRLAATARLTEAWTRPARARRPSHRRLASAARLTEAWTRPPRARCRSHRRRC